MDAAVFFLPVALVVVSYLMPLHKGRSSVARDNVPCEGCDA